MGYGIRWRNRPGRSTNHSPVLSINFKTLLTSTLKMEVICTSETLVYGAETQNATI
jgi:hypothetical protein